MFTIVFPFAYIIKFYTGVDFSCRKIVPGIIFATRNGVEQLDCLLLEDMSASRQYSFADYKSEGAQTFSPVLEGIIYVFSQS
jgi:hypothetical protein